VIEGGRERGVGRGGVFGEVESLVKDGEDDGGEWLGGGEEDLFVGNT